MPTLNFEVRVPKLAFLQPAQALDFIIENLSRVIFGELERVAEGVKRGTPVDLGVLRGSIHTTFERQPANANLLLRGTVQSGREAPYARFVEEGAGPAVGRPRFRPPIAALQPWARRVLGDEDLAWAVQFTIFERGLRPVRMFESVWERERPQIERNVNDAWERIVAALGNL